MRTNEKREGSARRVVRLWLAGWQAFAGVAGGRAQDLVGGNPWRADKAPGWERDRAQA